MPVKIHNKDYFTVAERIAQFRKDYVDCSIQTELIESGQMVVMKATISQDGAVISTGYAEEERGSTNINKTSALENAETSAVGRALAFFGLAGTEIASADEVANAISQQTEKAIYERIGGLAKAVLEHSASIHVIKGGIADGDYTQAAEAWFELTDDEKKSLWIAPTKGGVFTTEERRIMQTQEFRQAHFGEDEPKKHDAPA